MNVLHDLVRRVERIEALDRLAKPLVRVVGPMVRPPAVRNLLSGTYVGHPLHPMLTDVPIGAWGMSVVLDAVGGAGRQSAADLLVNVGVAAAAPTAASGLNDWSYTNGRKPGPGWSMPWHEHGAEPVRGVCRGAGPGQPPSGKALGLAGFAVLRGGYLGGHLSFVLGVNVNRTAWQDGPREWTAVLADADLAEGEHRKVDAAGIPILLYRTAGRRAPWRAPAATWAARWQRARSATAALPARGTAASSGSPMAASSAVRLARLSLATRRRSGTVRSRSCLAMMPAAGAKLSAWQSAAPWPG